MILQNNANMKKLMLKLEQKNLPLFLPEVILGDRENQKEEMNVKVMQAVLETKKYNEKQAKMTG